MNSKLVLQNNAARYFVVYLSIQKGVNTFTDEGILNNDVDLNNEKILNL